MGHEATKKLSIPELGIEAQVIIALLRKMQVGDTLSYETITTAVGRDVRYKARSSLQTAVRYVERNDGVVIGAIRAVGIKRLDDLGIISKSATHMQKSRRQATRVARISQLVKDFDALPQERKSELAILQSKAGLIVMFTGKKAEETLRLAVDQDKSAVPPMRMLDHFRDKK